MAEPGGFEPPKRFSRSPTFQVGAINRSATTPEPVPETGPALIFSGRQVAITRS